MELDQAPELQELIDQTLKQLRSMEKAQVVRLLDVSVLGPMMIMSAMGRKPPKILRTSMLLIGIGTIVYNGYNYLQIQKIKGKQASLVEYLNFLQAKQG